MNIITIDFETFYDQKYRLGKLTTEEYIRDDRFQIIGVSLKENNSPAEWYDHTEIQDVLSSKDFSSCAILAHNCAFDGAILSWKYGIKPRLWLDTMLMAKPFHRLTGYSLGVLSRHYNIGVKGDEREEAVGKQYEDFTSKELADYAEYCKNDVELTWKLFNKLVKKLPKPELLTIHHTLRMFTHPLIQLDKKILKETLKKIKSDKLNLIKGLTKADPEVVKKTLLSNNKFAKMLEAVGVEPPVKISITTNKPTYAFSKGDKEFIDLLDHENPTVKKLVEARIAIKSTIEETRVERLLGVADRGALPIQLKYYGAHTGRFSGDGKLNLQNFMRKGNLRKALTLPEPHRFIACDLSQIEARLTAYLAGEDDLVEAFRGGRDVYCEFASEIYGRYITKKDKTERFIGKTCILGLGYGMGAERLVDTLRTTSINMGGDIVRLPIKEARRIVELYRNRNYMLRLFWGKCEDTLSNIMYGSQTGELCAGVKYDAEGFILPNELRINYEGLKKSDTNEFVYIFNKSKDGSIVWSKLYGGKVTENVIQALARIVITEKSNVIGQKYPLLFQVHDEIVVRVHRDKEDEAKEYIKNLMSTPPEWAKGLPVACEVKSGSTYGDMK